MQAAELMVRCLEAEGVERIFAIPGEETLEIVEALRQSPIEIVIVRHEQGAAFMADVHGRLTGRAGVCLGTLGPGATNLITGIGDAYLDYAPMVAITGQVRLDLVHKESHQYVDVVDMLRPVTKWNARIERPETVPEVVRKAFKLAEAERPGPTHLELSETIAAADLPSSSAAAAEERARAQPARPGRRARGGGDDPGGAPAGDHHGQRRDPRRGAPPDLRALCAHAGIPASPTFMGKGALDDRSLLSLPAVGLQARDSMTAGLDEADVVVCVGYDLVEFGPAGVERRATTSGSSTWTPAPPRSTPTTSRRSSWSATSARRSTALREELPPGDGAGLRDPPARRRHHRAARRRRAARLREPAGGDPRDPRRDGARGHPRLGRRRPQAVARPAVPGLRAEHGDHQQRLRDDGHRPARRDRRVPSPSPSAASSRSRGDGGFLMNVQEMETATRLGLPVIVVVWVDGAYGVIGWKQERRFGRTHAIEFGNPGWADLARAFGWSHRHATDGAALGEALEAAPWPRTARRSSPCPIDYRQNVRLASLGEPALGA